jgi:hypothetical protein
MAKNIHIIGIMIDEHGFLLHEIDEIPGRKDISRTIDGFSTVCRFLSASQLSTAEIVIAYNASFPIKERFLRDILVELKKHNKDPFPILYSIGRESSALDPEISKQFLMNKEFSSTNNYILDLQEIVKLAKNEILMTRSSPTNISMEVWGGFMALLGAIAVVTAVCLLCTASMYIAAGITVAATATLAGIGFFATGACRNKQSAAEESLGYSEVLAQP